MKVLRILLAGGGSGGPVSPLLAVAAEIKKIKPQAQFLFVGTKKGPEKIMVGQAGINFVSIHAAKYRRYFSIKNFFDIFIFILSLWQSYSIVKKFRPNLVFAGGSFVSVPVCFMAKWFGAKIAIHQQDARIGLANKLIAPIADVITTAFEATSKEFYSGSGLFTKKWRPAAFWVGNPVRPEIFLKQSGSKLILLHNQLPLLLVLGGATGAAQINGILAEALSELIKSHQVVHQTGKGKKIDFKHPDYHPYELIPFPHDYPFVLQRADIVLARAGLSTIAELSALGKVAVIIPMHNTHQEENAKILRDTQSAVVLSLQEAQPETLIRVINSLKFDPKRQKLLGDNMKNLMPHDAVKRITELIYAK